MVEFLIQKLYRLEKELRNTSKTQKEKILELAEVYEQGIQENNPEILKRMRNLLKKDNLERHDICNAISKWCESEDIASERMVYKTLPKRLKGEYSAPVQNVTALEAESLSETQLWSDDKKEAYFDSIRDDVENIKNRRKPMVEKPKLLGNKDEVLESIKGFSYPCLLAQRIAKLLEKFLEEHEEHHDIELEKKYDNILKSAIDARHIASEKEMEAVVLAIEYGASIKNVADGQQYVLSFHEIYNNWIRCEECSKDPKRCIKQPHCRCICHAVMKKGTTKGVKFAINSNKHLKEFRERLQAQKNNPTADLCEDGKIILFNGRFEGGLKKSDLKRAIVDHIEFTDCLLCPDFLTKHPKFLDENV